LNQYNIRPASSVDLEDICAIEQESFSAPYPRYLLRKLIDERTTSFLVAVDDSSKITGYCVLSLERNAGHLISIAVEPEYRRIGIASALMENMIRLAVSQGAKEVWLEVKTDNEAAIALYLKFKFTKSMVIENYYSDGSPALRMQLALTSQPATVQRVRLS
jgi:ribosomal-protein-alanine N-acetyltransferase